MSKTIEEILAEATNPAYHRVATVRILLRQDLIEEHARLNRELGEAQTDDDRLNREPEAPRLAAELKAYEAEIDEHRVAFKFRSVGARKWSDLLAKYAPTKEQLKAYPRAEYNPVTFPAAAVAASMAEPEMNLEQARALEASINQGAWEQLFAQACNVNVGGLDTPKSDLAGFILRVRDAYASSAPSTASLDQSSLDGS